MEIRQLSLKSYVYGSNETAVRLLNKLVNVQLYIFSAIFFICYHCNTFIFAIKEFSGSAGAKEAGTPLLPTVQNVLTPQI